MTPNKPQKTAADFMVIALSPALIMMLVGSLCFFLIDVFYRGQMQGGMRWVMFWFVLAIVLVSRIAIEKTSEYAAIYGFALALTVWFYLVKTQTAYLFGIVLLGIVWFCAHKLVWDCTLIDDDEDSSGSGLLQKTPPAKVEAKSKAKRKRASGSPGRWLIWFSLAALPLFGIGQCLLPAGDADSRRRALIFVLFYMTASLGLLLTTSFLGLRRYLRQRYLRMPAVVAWSWLKLGGGVAFVILLAALFLPRPGANQAWSALRYQVDYRLQQASRYASRSNPPGQGEGRSGNDSGGKQGEGKSSDQQKGGQPAPSQNGTAPPAQPEPGPGNIPAGAAGSLYGLLRAALLIFAAIVACWWLFRCRYLLLEMGRTIMQSIADFLRKLLDLKPAWRSTRRMEPVAPRSTHLPLADYKNPFFADEKHRMPPAEIILYSYNFAQAWAKENGIQLHSEQTAREFCEELAAHSPELAMQYRQLSFLYAHAAYGRSLPAHCDMEPLKELWRQLTWPQANASPSP